MAISFYVLQLPHLTNIAKFVLKIAKLQQNFQPTVPTIQPTTKSIHIQSLNNNIFYQYDYANIRKDINW